MDRTPYAKREHDRRSEIDRREYTYAYHCPERRSGEDRRAKIDRGDKERDK